MVTRTGRWPKKIERHVSRTPEGHARARAAQNWDFELIVPWVKRPARRKEKAKGGRRVLVSLPWVAFNSRKQELVTVRRHAGWWLKTPRAR